MWKDWNLPTHPVQGHTSGETVILGTYPAVGRLIHIALYFPGVGHQVLHPPVFQRRWVGGGEYGLYSVREGKSFEGRKRPATGKL